MAALMALSAWMLWRHPKEAAAEPLVVYCAVGLKLPVEALAVEFEKQYGVGIQLQYGGSGTLLNNLQLARVGDLFVAADSSYMRLACQKNVVDEVLPLVELKPALAVKKGNPKHIRGLSDLARTDVRVVLGNPDAASIGKYSRDILTRAGLWEKVEELVRRQGVFKPTVSDLANDIRLGAVDAGIIWDAMLRQYPDLEMVGTTLPTPTPIQVEVGVLRFCRQPTLALRFARYLNSRAGNAVFKKHGYQPVEGDAWDWKPQITFYSGSVNRNAVEDTLKKFAAREGVEMNTIYNGCGILTAQMRTLRKDRDGAGFPDAYLACDRYYLDTVKDWFQEDVNISTADIVMAVPKGNPRQLQTLRDLARPGVRVSVGQPEQCTIGALTRILLEKSGLYDQVMSNVVMQTSSSSMLVPGVATKSVDAAIVYKTDTLKATQTIEVLTIDSPYAKAVQPFSLAKSSEHKYLGRRLFMALARSRADYEKAGFQFCVTNGTAEAGE